MKRTLKLLPDVLTDMDRLEVWLEGRNPRAANEAAGAIVAGISSLVEFPERGRPVGASGLRELFVRFGQEGYVIQYRVTQHHIVVAHVFHGREQR